MKRLWGVAAVLFGVGLCLLGLLFLLGAAGRAGRYAVAVVALALGGSLAGLGVRLFRSADAASPEQLRAELMAAAGKHNGELSEDDVEAALGRRANAGWAVLAGLCDEGACRENRREGARYWVFPGLQPRLLVRRCEYCKAELPLIATAEGERLPDTCPNCGGTVKTGLERRALSEDDQLYSMDDE